MLREDSEYRIISLVFKDTQASTRMAKLQLKGNRTDELFNCVIWQEALEKTPKNVLKTGNIIKIKKYEHNENYNNYILYSLELVREESIGLCDAEKKDLLGKIYELIESFEHVKLKKAVLKVIVENEELYTLTPASEKIHHNYTGGLMQHTWECINIAKVLFGAIYTDVNRELVIAGCIVHDLGKMFEYVFDGETGAIARDAEFEKIWINHIHWGFSWANQNDLPELAHIIASHHGIKEWKALVEPETPEAFLVHYIDNISSKLGAVNIKDFERCSEEQLKLF